jgi:beta-mannosidase
MLPSDHPCSCHTISLSGRDWFIKMADPANGPDQDHLFDASSGAWIPARVPGNIQSDHESAHRLKPLWYGLGDPALVNVARHDWWYGKKFSVSEEALKKKAQLVFHGVDFTCDVWLNAVRLGTHHGMFQKFWFDVTGLLKATDNVLSVKIHRMPEHLLPYLLGSDGAESGYRSPYWFVHGMNKTRQTL